MNEIYYEAEKVNRDKSSLSFEPNLINQEDLLEIYKRRIHIVQNSKKAMMNL